MFSVNVIGIAPASRRCCFICLLQNLHSFAARFGRGLSDQSIKHLRNKFLLALGQLVDGFQLLLPFRSGATFTHSGFLLLTKQLFECGRKQPGQLRQRRYLDTPLAAVLILIMKQETIMTTEITILRAPDVAASNDVINLPRANESGDSVISAASLVVSSSSHESSIEVLSYIRKEIDKKLLGYSLYAFFGNSTWQPDTRVVRYRGL